MKFNQIEVLFFSKNAQLRDTFSSIFCDEEDFSFRGLSSIEELCDLTETPINGVFIVDFSGDCYPSSPIFQKRNARFLPLPMIFLLDNKIPNNTPLRLNSVCACGIHFYRPIVLHQHTWPL